MAISLRGANGGIQMLRDENTMAYALLIHVSEANQGGANADKRSGHLNLTTCNGINLGVRAVPPSVVRYQSK